MWDHEWIEVDGGNGTVGITDYAQSQLGDITYVELPAEGQAVIADSLAERSREVLRRYED